MTKYVIGVVQQTEHILYFSDLNYKTKTVHGFKKKEDAAEECSFDTKEEAQTKADELSKVEFAKTFFFEPMPVEIK